jgi:hypothetical protein
MVKERLQYSDEFTEELERQILDFKEKYGRFPTPSFIMTLCPSGSRLRVWASGPQERLKVLNYCVSMHEYRTFIELLRDAWTDEALDILNILEIQHAQSTH